MELQPQSLVTKPLTVTQHLAELGWEPQNFRDIIDAATGARRRATKFHPKGSAGYFGWSEGISAIRTAGSAKGWLPSDEGGVPSCFDPVRRNKFTFCNTDAGTGTGDPFFPQNIGKRGNGTKSQIIDNGVFNFYNDARTLVTPLNKGNAVIFWVVCFYCNGDDVRAELACPVTIDKGFFNGFHRRLDLTSIISTVPVMTRNTEEDSGIEIKITRKQG